MSDEKMAPLPLTGEEVQEAVLSKIKESFNRTCHLKYDNAYTSFKAEIHIKFTLSDYGRTIEDNHAVEVSGSSGIPETETRTVETDITMEPAPPNQVRVESGQPVPVKVNEGGKTVIKHLKYAARKAAKAVKETVSEPGPDHNRI